MVPTTDAEVLFAPESDALRFLPEGPMPLGDGAFSWVAIQHGPEATTGSLNRFEMAAGNNSEYPLPGRPGFAFPTTVDDTFLVGCERQLGLYDCRGGGWTELLGGIDAQVSGTIINDGVCLGSDVIFGCKDLSFQTPKAGLYLYRGSDRTLHQLRDDQICSNGKELLTRDGVEYLLDIDSPTQTIVRYRLDRSAARLSERELIVDLRAESVFPDGMILTPDGESLIVALYNPNDAPYGEARQYALATGQLERVWRTPHSPQVTCPQLVSFGGRVKLILTTAVEHMSDERRQQHVNAGCLFAAETDFQSVPPAPRFAYWPAGSA